MFRQTGPQADPRWRSSISVRPTGRSSRWTTSQCRWLRVRSSASWGRTGPGKPPPLNASSGSGNRTPGRSGCSPLDPGAERAGLHQNSRHTWLPGTARADHTVGKFRFKAQERSHGFSLPAPTSKSDRREGYNGHAEYLRSTAGDIARSSHSPDESSATTPGRATDIG
jgi:hypothetical protein